MNERIKNFLIDAIFSIVIIGLLCCFILMVVGLANLDSQIQKENWPDVTVKRIEYIKDPRTNLCFATIGSHDTFSITCVPCESIPEDMLHTAKAENLIEAGD